MQTKFAFVAMIMVMLSCTLPEKKVDDHAVTNKDDDHIAHARKMFDAFNQHQWQVMANYYSDSALFLDPAFGKTYIKQSRSQTVEKYALLQRVFPDIKDEIVAMYPSDNKVIVEFISTGTLASGAVFQLPIITVLTFENDLIVKDATYYDVENSEEENSEEEGSPEEIEIP